MRTNMDIWQVNSDYYTCPQHSGYSGFDNYNDCNICHYFWMRWQEDWEAFINKTNGITFCNCNICDPE